jgi:hypothetical protein
VPIQSFQGEEKGISDHVYAFTDKDGTFQSDCIPGATYTLCVNDGQLQSNMIDLVPYEKDAGKSNLAELKVAEGNLIEIRVTSGPRNEPMRIDDSKNDAYLEQFHEGRGEVAAEGPIQRPPLQVFLESADPFGFPSTSHWTGAGVAFLSSHR